MRGNVAMFRGSTVYHVASLNEFSSELFKNGSVLHDCETESYYVKTESGYVPLSAESITPPLWFQDDEPEFKPSSKCAYCGCTNDHIYGTCDYCGAPLDGGGR